MKWLIIVMMIVLSNICYGKGYYTTEGLVYFWDFENEVSFLNDVKKNVGFQSQGKVRWVPPDHSFNQSGVVHLHGDKSEGTMLLVPAHKMDMELTDWTIDFEFGIGSHPLDHRKRNAGNVKDGHLFQWGDIKVTFFRRTVSQGFLVVNYRGREKFIEGINGHGWYYMAFRSEDDGVSVWLNSYCTNYIISPRRSVRDKQISFGGNGFAGRLDDIKLYSKRLRPWEITKNYWGTEYSIDPKDKITTTWAEVKKNVKQWSGSGGSEKNVREWKKIKRAKKEIRRKEG